MSTLDGLGFAFRSSMMPTVVDTDVHRKHPSSLLGSRLGGLIVVRSATTALAAVWAVGGCNDPVNIDSDPDSQATTMGPSHRFVVDRFALPVTSAAVRAFAGDVGDRHDRNSFGLALSAVANYGFINPRPQDLISIGQAFTSVELFADDLAEDDTIGIKIIGVGGTQVAPIGGRIQNGILVSNRTASTKIVGEATVLIPIFANATPSSIPLSRFQLELNSDGHGGYDGRVFALVPEKAVETAFVDGLVQTLNAHPESQPFFYPQLNTNRDRAVSRDEVLNDRLVKDLIEAELKFAPDGSAFIGHTFGFGIHLLPCDAGRCLPTPLASCYDLVSNGDETDVDCGGSCKACLGGRFCSVGADCAYNRCDGEICAGASCVDGIGSVWESDIDCGITCMACGYGKRCRSDADCDSHFCDQTCKLPALR
jgi:hypothetical protein